MQVQHIEIVNFKGIGELSLSPKGRNVYAIGPNGGGKTSFIDSVFKTLTGKNLPTKLTKEGERKGSVKVDLGAVVVEASFDSKKEKMNLTVSTPEGDKYPTPRTMMDTLVGTIDFDVAAFLALTPRKQVDFLKAALGLDLSDLDDEYKKAFEARSESNRQLKWLEANSKPYDSSKTEPVDVTQLQVKRNDVAHQNITRAHKQKDFERLGQEIETGTRNLEILRKQMEELDSRITAAVNEQMDVEVWLDTNPAVDEAQVVADMAAAVEHNKAVENTAKELAHRADVKKEQKENERLNDLLADIEARKSARIQAVKMPVEGMEFTEDGLLLDGLPFESEQVNTAKQIIAGLQICGMLHKEVQIARFDGTLLDNANLRHVEEWAAQHGIQLFIELVDRENTGGLRVEISE